jgi:hypothetical protein
MFCAPQLIFGGTEGVGSRFHVSHSRTLFQWWPGRPISFSCFPLPDMSSAVPRASGPVFIFCAPGLVFSDIVGVGSRFHVLRYRTHFWRYRGRRVPFSCFALSDYFSAVPRASSPVFIFCAPGLIFGDTGEVRSCFIVLRPNSFSTVRRASGFVFMFCAPRLIFGGTGGVGSRFHVLRAPTHFRRYRARRVPFSCFER